MAGAHALAEALAAGPDRAEALRRYEAQHRARVAPRQRNIGRAAAVLVPRTRLGVGVRNLAARALGQGVPVGGNAS
jgi:2-polyprenyl-6-methoxyphenol hydroxylase-like FAD-dependent oxidoreductase